MGFPEVQQNVTLNTDAPAQNASAFFNTFTERFKQGRVENALARVQHGDPKGMEELYALSPELAMRVQDQQRQQAEAERERAARRAEGRFLIDSNPNNPAVATAVNNGADPTRLSVTQGRQSRGATANLRNWGLAHDQVSGMLGSVTDQNSYATVRARARQIYSDAGFDTMVSYIDSLPDTYTPQLVQQLQSEAMTSKDQLSAILNRDRLGETVRHNGVTEGQGDRRIDETVRHNGVNEGQGQQRIDETGRHNQANEGLGTGRLNETQRHNGVTEGQGAQRVEQGAARVQQGAQRVDQGQQRINQRNRGRGGGPRVGQVVNGYRFNGGDPRNRANWSPAQ